MKIYFLIIASLIIIRFINLTSLPLFGDEALYLYLADKFQENTSAAFDSIYFGVMPLVIWMQAFLQKFTFNLVDPLILGRAFSVVTDLGAAWLVYKIGKMLFNKRVGLITVFIYLMLPLNFLQSRMILLDSFTNFATLLTIYLFLKYNPSYNSHLKQKLLLSLSLVLSFFIKPLAIVTYPTTFLLPFALNVKNIKRSWLTISIHLSQIILLAAVLIAILYLPISQDFSEKFISTSNNSLSTAITHFKANLWRVGWWTSTYLTLPVIFTTIIAVFYGVYLKNIKVLWLVFWLLSIIILDCIFSANFFPRHLYPLVAPVSLLSAFLFNHLLNFNRYLGIILLILAFFPAGSFIGQLLINPQQAPLALEDRQQYFEDWTSGAGNEQIAQKLAEISASQPVTVFTEDSANQAWTFSHIYDTGQSVIIPSEDLLLGKFISQESLAKISAGEKVYLILNTNSTAPTVWPVRLIFSYPKGPNRSINLYQVIR